MPAIQFLCSACGSRLQVEENQAGNQAICPMCGAVVAVPTAEAEATEIPYASPSPMPQPSGAQPPRYQQGYPQPVSRPNEPFAIVSFVCSLAGIVCWVTSIVGIVFGHIALSRIKASGEQLGGRGFATAGLVIGYVWLVFMIVLIVIYLFFIFMIFSQVLQHGDFHVDVREAIEAQEKMESQEPVERDTEEVEEPAEQENPFRVDEEQDGEKSSEDVSHLACEVQELYCMQSTSHARRLT